MTPGAIFEDLADRLATARTRFLLGEHAEARALLESVWIDYLRHRDALRGMAGHAALVHSFETAQRAMQV